MSGSGRPGGEGKVPPGLKPVRAQSMYHTVGRIEKPGVAWIVGCHGPGVEEASEKWMDDASDDDGNHGMSINGIG